VTRPTVCILAAGRGSRLGDLTTALPKNLLELGNGTILDHQLAALAQADIPDEAVRLVTGHAAEVLQERFGERFGLIHNPLWDVHNNIVTVQRLAQEVPDDLLLINGDTLFSPGILRSLLDAPGDAVLSVDTTGQLAEEQMKVRLIEGRLERIGKDLDPATSDGEYIGLLHFRGAALATYYRELGRMIEAGQTEDWYEGGLNGIADGVPITTASTHGLRWVEVDTPKDLAQARDMAGTLGAA
jgi:choline kinase